MNRDSEERELIFWLKLVLTPRFGAKKCHQLLSKFNIETLLDFQRDDFSQLGLSPAQIQFLLQDMHPKIEACLAWRLKGKDRYILSFNNPRYPALLKLIPNPPPLLFIQGQYEYLNCAQVAMVGSRNASFDGKKSAQWFTSQIAKAGYIPTSGLALGIDGQVHQASLNENNPTIAVLGSGLNYIYPAKHKSLAAQIAEHGVLVSEFMPHAAPKSYHFPQRNRIISGLSIACFVVEASVKSGSLITARYALEQGRDVFSLPYSIYQPVGGGNNQLLHEGAGLVFSPEMLIEQLDLLRTHYQMYAHFPKQNKQVNFNEKQKREQNKNAQLKLVVQLPEKLLPFEPVFANVGTEPVPIDILSERTHIPVHEVMLQALELELAGYITAVSGGYVRLSQ